MIDLLSVENNVFNSLDSYIDNITKTCLARYQAGKFNHLPKHLFKIGEEGEYTIFFLCAEPLLEILGSAAPEKELELLKDLGFFLLTPIKTNVAIGKGYVVSYCQNNSRIISKNLTSYGYIFIAPTSSLAKVSEELILCRVQDAAPEEQGKVKIRRLVELFPKLFIFFNGKANHQALVLELDLKN